MRIIEEETFCEKFHKLPNEVRQMDIFDYDCFISVLAGRSSVKD